MEGTPMILEAIVTIASVFTGGNCAIINNTTNEAAWKTQGSPVVTTTYEDDGRVLLYGRYPKDTDTLVALIRAEDLLQVGVVGPKIRMQCLGNGEGYEPR